jgi:alkanesulfonate monooxygenase SsuD/methylene tetrahydromethanopterin reductase-like flavin-dependent oxidoreductase (luciferase family)
MIVVCAESDEEARALAAPLELQWARWDSGQRHHAPPTFEHAAAYQYSPTEERARRRAPGRFIVGTGEHVAAQLRQLATDAQVDELMTVNMIPDHQAQLKSCELLADAFGLTPRQ